MTWAACYRAVAPGASPVVPSFPADLDPGASSVVVVAAAVVVAEKA